MLSVNGDDLRTAFLLEPTSMPLPSSALRLKLVLAATTAATLATVLLVSLSGAAIGAISIGATSPTALAEAPQCNFSFPAHILDCDRCWSCPLCSLAPVQLSTQCAEGITAMSREHAPFAPKGSSCCVMCAFFCDQPATPATVAWAHTHGLNGGDGRDQHRSLCGTMKRVCPAG